MTICGFDHFGRNFLEGREVLVENHHSSKKKTHLYTLELETVYWASEFFLLKFPWKRSKADLIKCEWRSNRLQKKQVGFHVQVAIVWWQDWYVKDIHIPNVTRHIPILIAAYVVREEKRFMQLGGIVLVFQKSGCVPWPWKRVRSNTTSCMIQEGEDLDLFFFSCMGRVPTFTQNSCTGTFMTCCKKIRWFVNSLSWHHLALLVSLWWNHKRNWRVIVFTTWYPMSSVLIQTFFGTSSCQPWRIFGMMEIVKRDLILHDYMSLDTPWEGKLLGLCRVSTVPA